MNQTINISSTGSATQSAMSARVSTDAAEWSLSVSSESVPNSYSLRDFTDTAIGLAEGHNFNPKGKLAAGAAATATGGGCFRDMRCLQDDGHVAISERAQAARPLAALCSSHLHSEQMTVVGRSEARINFLRKFLHMLQI